MCPQSTNDLEKQGKRVITTAVIFFFSFLFSCDKIYIT